MPARRELLELLRHAKEDPDDAPRRAVLADWLEENGDETDRQRARVLRACLETPEETRFSLYESDPRFRTVVPPEWPPLKDRFKVVGCHRWGFLHVEATAKDFRERFENTGEETREWVGTLTLQHEGTGQLNRLPCFAGLLRLHLGGMFTRQVWNVAPLLKDGLPLLREFLCTGSLSNRAFESLVRACFVPRLKLLSLNETTRGQRITDRPLFSKAPFGQLRQFSCGIFLLGRLGRGPWTHNLEHLAFEQFEWEADDWPLNTLGELPKLRRLDLRWEGPLGRLIDGLHLEEIPILDTFSYTHTHQTVSLPAFARWPLLRQLRHLQLGGGSHDREEGLRLLLELPLETLDLSGLRLTPIQLDWLRRHAHDRVRLPETATEKTD